MLIMHAPRRSDLCLAMYGLATQPHPPAPPDDDTPPEQPDDETPPGQPGPDKPVKLPGKEPAQPERKRHVDVPRACNTTVANVVCAAGGSTVYLSA